MVQALDVSGLVVDAPWLCPLLDQNGEEMQPGAARPSLPQPAGSRSSSGDTGLEDRTAAIEEEAMADLAHIQEQLSMPLLFTCAPWLPHSALILHLTSMHGVALSRRVRSSRRDQIATSRRHSLAPPAHPRPAHCAQRQRACEHDPLLPWQGSVFAVCLPAGHCTCDRAPRWTTSSGPAVQSGRGLCDCSRHGCGYFCNAGLTWQSFCRQIEAEVEFPMEVLLRALQPALSLPPPLAQWPLQLLYASCIVSFPTMRARVRPPCLAHLCRFLVLLGTRDRQIGDIALKSKQPGGLCSSHSVCA